MSESPSLHENHLGKYSVRAAAERAGLSAATLRAWERRYGLPAPRRDVQGYRLYSDHDIRTLRWLKTQTETGLSISRAVQVLSDLRAAGQDPVADMPRRTAPSPTAAPHHLTAECLAAFKRLDEPAAQRALQLAFVIHPLESVLNDIVRPALVELGEAWHRGEVSVTVEHFATQLVLRHMMSLLGAAGPPSRAGVIVAACAPGEQHEIGLLMIALMLRRRGWQVKYLGPNLALDGLAQTLGPLRPAALLFTAARLETAQSLNELTSRLAEFPAPAPRIFLGGPGFDHWPPNLRLPGTRVKGDLMEAVLTIENGLPDRD